MSKKLYIIEFANIPHTEYSFEGQLTVAVSKEGVKKFYINDVSYDLDELIYGEINLEKNFQLSDLQDVKILKGTKAMFWPEGLRGCSRHNIGSKAIKMDGFWDIVNSKGVIFKQGLTDEDILYALNKGELKIQK